MPPLRTFDTAGEPLGVQFYKPYPYSPTAPRAQSVYSKHFGHKVPLQRLR